jgi:hypothetical protein
MSRSYFSSEPGRWRMFCDICFAHDEATFDAAPPLLPFHQAGWFIGQRVDACPTCAAAGRLPDDAPNQVVLAAAAEVAA